MINMLPFQVINFRMTNYPKMKMGMVGSKTAAKYGMTSLTGSKLRTTHGMMSRQAE